MNGSAPQAEKSYFEQQRDALVGEIAQVPLIPPLPPDTISLPFDAVSAAPA